MERYFNVTGFCNPKEHYMVNISARLEVIKKLIDRGQYFTINRGRQYGKTTTLRALRSFLADEYYVISLDFQKNMTEIEFKDQFRFAVAFAKAFTQALKRAGAFAKFENEIVTMNAQIKEEFGLLSLFENLSDICTSSDKPLVLLIDEVDQASNSQVFLDFLAQLRGAYMDRSEIPTFKSVILAGVHDIRNLKQKIRPDAEHKHNSPWNIAVSFDVDMSLSATGIAGMLMEYENDHHTGMDVRAMAQLIYDYTSGYPVLVSMFCKLLDENVSGGAEYPTKADAWTKEGFLQAEKLMNLERMPLFESLINKLEQDEKLRKLLYSVLFTGEKIPFSLYDASLSDAMMYGFLKELNGSLVIANRVFQTTLCDWFLALEFSESDISKVGSAEKQRFIQDGHLNMELILEWFIDSFQYVYGEKPQKFIEDDGRKCFLLFLRPIINGTGHYYIETQTSDQKRMDVVVDYLGEQFVVELKIWHGEEYNSRGEKQLSEYLNYFRLKKGYMLSFNFNQKKQTGVHTIQLGDKTIVEAVV